MIFDNFGVRKHRLPVWRKVPHSSYLCLMGVAGCLVLAFRLGGWGRELALVVPLVLILLYMAKDIFDER